MRSSRKAEGPGDFGERLCVVIEVRKNLKTILTQGALNAMA